MTDLAHKISKLDNLLFVRATASDAGPEAKILHGVSRALKQTHEAVTDGNGAQASAEVKAAIKGLQWLAANHGESPEFAQLKEIFSEVKSQYGALKAAKVA
jgi:hypothetical protein